MMAEIRDGVFAFVSGTVRRTFMTKSGEAFELEVKREGLEYPDRVTVWGCGGVGEGDRVTVKGYYSDRREKYHDQQGNEKIGFKRALNKPEIVAHEPAAASSGGSMGDWVAQPENAPQNGFGGVGFGAGFDENPF